MVVGTKLVLLIPIIGVSILLFLFLCTFRFFCTGQMYFSVYRDTSSPKAIHSTFIEIVSLLSVLRCLCCLVVFVLFLFSFLFFWCIFHEKIIILFYITDRIDTIALVTPAED